MRGAVERGLFNLHSRQRGRNAESVLAIDNVAHTTVDGGSLRGDFASGGGRIL